jgi:predicted porin
LGLSYEQGPLYVGAGYQAQQAFGSAVEVQMSQLNATYDLTSVKLLGALGRVANSNGVTGDTATEWQIGVDVPVSSALTVSAGYASSTTDFLAAGAADAKHTAFSVGGKYALSKRTFAFAGIASAKLDTTNVTVNTYAFGINHTF